MLCWGWVNRLSLWFCWCGITTIIEVFLKILTALSVSSCFFVCFCCIGSLWVEHQLYFLIIWHPAFISKCLLPPKLRFSSSLLNPSCSVPTLLSTGKILGHWAALFSLLPPLLTSVLKGEGDAVPPERGSCSAAPVFKTICFGHGMSAQYFSHIRRDAPSSRRWSLYWSRIPADLRTECISEH